MKYALRTISADFGCYWEIYVLENKQSDPMIVAASSTTYESKEKAAISGFQYAKANDMQIRDLITYINTLKNEREIGWDRVPEYCYGDLSSKFVTHDHVFGKFYFHN